MLVFGDLNYCRGLAVCGLVRALCSLLLISCLTWDDLLGTSQSWNFAYDFNVLIFSLHWARSDNMRRKQAALSNGHVLSATSSFTHAVLFVHCGSPYRVLASTFPLQCDEAREPTDSRFNPWFLATSGLTG
ncbi:uncharacterized protein EI90DRAFT_1312479 [Cantharellus anzutake]|uniref:uncharacterized protein n=1 Tax=Cantharellus anzutake TaxID=1750568 RepID=UPI00190894D0|nr:uncharacterized protein EI90DRAFT_1312479 [Cantharellus anzutake]KAF8342188.1 hypothetical protein EI90DRAFT_1312479 [Cantharellus anzutake]